MLEITHTGKWPQPIVVTVARGIHSYSCNLLVNETKPVEGEVSPELKALVKKGYITFRQLTPPVAPTTDAEMTPEEIAKLEAELLNEDGSDAVSKEED